jgi:hypothetical protein
MFYLALAFCLLVTGISLITGDGTLLRVPYDFAEYKNVAGFFLLGCSIFLFRAGNKSLRNL